MQLWEKQVAARLANDFADLVAVCPCYKNGWGSSVLCVGLADSFESPVFLRVLDSLHAILPPAPFTRASPEEVAACVRFSLPHQMAGKNWLVVGQGEALVKGGLSGSPGAVHHLKAGGSGAVWFLGNSVSPSVRAGQAWETVSGKSETIWFSCIPCPHRLEASAEDRAEDRADSSPANAVATFKLSLRAGLSKLDHVTLDDLLPARTLQRMFAEQAANGPVSRVISPYSCYCAPEFDEVLTSALLDRFPSTHDLQHHQDDCGNRQVVLTWHSAGR